MAQTSPDYDFLAKILILGEPGVGKTCLWNQYCERQFHFSHICTIGIEFRVKRIEVNGKRVKLQIWDTAGQERFRGIVRTHYRGARGAVLCYSIDNRESFERIGYWMEEVKANARTEDICFMIMGTKSDICNERVVSFDEGKQLAESLGVKFFETSAKEDVNVDEAFFALAKDIVLVLSKKKIDTQTAVRIKPRENAPTSGVNCSKCS